MVPIGFFAGWVLDKFYFGLSSAVTFFNLSLDAQILLVAFQVFLWVGLWCSNFIQFDISISNLRFWRSQYFSGWGPNLFLTLFVLPSVVTTPSKLIVRSSPEFCIMLGNLLSTTIFKLLGCGNSSPTCTALCRPGSDIFIFSFLHYFVCLDQMLNFCLVRYSVFRNLFWVEFLFY